jgi:hypothetical protein
MQSGQQLILRAGSKFSEKRLGGARVTDGKPFSGDRDSTELLRIPLVPSLHIDNNVNDLIISNRKKND